MSATTNKNMRRVIAAMKRANASANLDQIGVAWNGKLHAGWGVLFSSPLMNKHDVDCIVRAACAEPTRKIHVEDEAGGYSIQVWPEPAKLPLTRFDHKRMDSLRNAMSDFDAPDDGADHLWIGFEQRAREAVRYTLDRRAELAAKVEEFEAEVHA